MTRMIAIANQKGGCAKTSTAVNLAAGFARQGDKSVLLIDIDPQANATAVFMGIEFAAGPRQKGTHTIYEVITGTVPVQDALYRVELEPVGSKDTARTLDILPAHLDLASAELELVNLFERERRLRRALRPIRDQYDLIIIDCPPSLGLLTINALIAANEIIIPVDPGVFPIIGLNLLQSTIQMVQQANTELRLMGVVPTLVDRTALARDTQEELEAAFGELLLPSIPRRVAVGEAHAAGQDIFLYDPQSDAAKAYRKLLQEVDKRG